MRFSSGFRSGVRYRLPEIRGRHGREPREWLHTGLLDRVRRERACALSMSHAAVVVSRFLIVGAWQVGSLCEDVAVTAAAVLPSGSPSLEVCVAALRPPAAWLTSDPAGPLTVGDRDCPQRLAVKPIFPTNLQSYPATTLAFFR